MLQLIASLASSFAWPLIVLILAFVLRGPLNALATGQQENRRVKRLKAGPVEIEWEPLDQASRELAEAGRSEGQLSSVPAITSTLEDDLLPLAESYPTAAVMMAFQRVEAAVYGALATSDALPSKRRVPIGEAVRLAYQSGLIPEELVRVVNDLRVLRNEVAHAVEPDAVGITPARAAQYVGIAETVVQALSDRHSTP